MKTGREIIGIIEDFFGMTIDSITFRVETAIMSTELVNYQDVFPVSQGTLTIHQMSVSPGYFARQVCLSKDFRKQYGRKYRYD